MFLRVGRDQKVRNDEPSSGRSTSSGNLRRADQQAEVQTTWPVVHAVCTLSEPHLAPRGTETMDEKLVQFVDHARDKGLDYATIRQLLVSSGWKDREIAEVFSARDLEVPIPKPTRVGRSASVRTRPGSVWPRRARDGLLHVLTFGALYTWVTSVIVLFFTYINFAFPDPAWRTSYAQLMAAMSLIRAQMATVIVAFPLFMILWHFLLREVHRDSERAGGGIRRWLIYLSIFVGALTLSGDVITLIYFLLEGQLTARLLLKAATLFLIAGGLVLYLTLTLRSETRAEAAQ